MRSNLIRAAGTLLCLSLVGCATAPVQTGSNVEAEILRLEGERRDTYIHGDTVRLGVLLADEYFVVGPGTRGGLRDRADALRALANRNRNIRSYDQEDTTVRIYGDVALVTGVQTIRPENIISQ